MVDKDWHNFHHDPEAKDVIQVYLPRWVALDLIEKIISQAKWDRKVGVEFMLIGRLSDHP